MIVRRGAAVEQQKCPASSAALQAAIMGHNRLSFLLLAVFFLHE
jgi:hypothetical protein